MEYRNTDDDTFTCKFYNSARPQFFVPETMPWRPWSYPENLEGIALPILEL